MVTLKSSIKKIVALLLMLTMVLTVVPCVASATEGDPNPLIDTERKGSITVTKYASADTSATKGNATGTDNDGNNVNNTYKPLNGAKFKLFKIADADTVMAYYNGTSTTTYSLEQFDYQDDGTATYNHVSIDQACTWEGTTSGTGENAGKYTFSNLPIGIYVLKEVTAPNQIAAPLAEDSLISIPMVNTAISSNNGNAEWMYDVYVYPKNHESTGTIELTKQDQNGTALKDVVFILYKKEFQSGGSLSADWAEVTGTTNNNGTSTTLTLTTDATGMITLANLPAGLYGTQYKLVEVSAPNGYIVNKTPLYFKVNNDNTITWNETSGDTNGCNNTNTGVTATMITTEPKLSITLRNELPSLTKEVKQNGGGDWKTDEQYRLDDEITYRLIAYVPNNVSEITYEITDLPDLGIDDSITWADDYAVTYADTKAALTDGSPDSSLRINTHYSLVAQNGTDKGQGFKLTLIDAGKTAVAGKYIQIVYKAHMNANAVIAGSGNGNTATLTYSKYIGNTDTSTYEITDEARVYTYQFQITKYKDSVADANKLKDGEQVEFQLLDASKNPMKVVKLAEGEYRLAIDTDSDTVKLDKMVTNTNSTILIRGLENGTYYLKETKTIANYNLLSKPFEFKVEVTETTKWTTPDGSIVKTYQSTTYTPTDPTGIATIINKKGFVLPQTGGMGYLLFCAVGIALIGGGAALIFGGRKKKIR